MLILREEEIMSLLHMDECMATLEAAFGQLASGDAVNVPRIDVSSKTDLVAVAAANGCTPDEFLGGLPARPQVKEGAREAAWGYVFKTMVGITPRLGEGIAALRLNSDVISYPVVDGLQLKDKVRSSPGYRYCGLVLLFSTRSGEPLAIMPDGYLQSFRVAGTGGLGTKYLARQDATTLGLLGSGQQARHAVFATKVARPGLKLVKVYSPTRANRERFAQEIREQTGIEVRPVENQAAAISGAGIVIAATNARDPIIEADALEPGMHFTNVAPNEVGGSVYQRADCIVIT